MNDLFDGFKNYGTYGGIKLPEAFEDGVYSDDSSIPLLNDKIWTTNNRTEIFQRLKTAIAVNAAWRIQRTYIMGFEMSAEEYDKLVARAGNNDKRLKWYYNGKGWYFQS